MNKEAIVLPRKDENGDYYLSYSQISTWVKSKRDYMRQYFLGETFEGNAYTDFGTKVGEALENNDFSEFTKEEQEFLKTVPRYDEFEREIALKFDGFYVKGFIDTNTLKGTKSKQVIDKIADYKTGDILKKTDDYVSDDYIQLDIYSAAIYQETGKLPTDTCVYLIGRDGNAFRGEELKLTLEYKKVEKVVTRERVNEVMEFVQRVAQDISDHYKVYLKLKELK